MSEDVEVIARKSGNAESINIMFIALGVIGIGVDLALWIILGIYGVFSFKEELGGTLLLIAVLIGILLVGIFFLALGLKMYINNSQLSDELIKYENGEFIFGDGYRCKPSDIVEVDCFKVERDGTPQMQAMRANPDAWLRVTTKDKIINYRQVEAVRDAYDRLTYYMQNALNEDTEQLSKNNI